MKNFRKGTFVTVPNREILRGLDPYSQVLFMWLCSYADENGICFPSMKKLSQDCGVTSRTIVNKMIVLEKKGLLQRTTRKKKNSKENAPNEYQIRLLEGSERDSVGSEPVSPRSERDSPHVVKEIHQGGERDSQELNPLNSTHTELNPQNSYEQEAHGEVVKSYKENSEKAMESVPGHEEIIEVIEAFGDVNSANSRWYGNTTQRRAVQDLLKIHGKKNVLQVIKNVLPTTNQKKFLPTVNTPNQLVEKWDHLKNSIKRQQAGKKPKSIEL